VDINIFEALWNWAPPSNAYVKLGLLNSRAYDSLWNVDIQGDQKVSVH
jgi:hypothetical protein